LVLTDLSKKRRIQKMPYYPGQLFAANKDFAYGLSNHSTNNIKKGQYFIINHFL
jgi:hypothetical protein